MAEYKDRKDNPLHREFGLWNNAVYILKKCMRYCPSVLVIALVGLVCESILTYYWGIIGKYVIDVIQTDKEIEHKANSFYSSGRRRCRGAYPVWKYIFAE